MLLLIDNYDSFTFNLRDYFLRLGEEVLVLKNDEINALNIHQFKYDKVVISPGPNTPYQSGNLMDVLPELIGRYPILGICLGHQALGEYFGAKLHLAKRPMHGKVSLISTNEEGIYKAIPNPFKVCRYHSLVLDLRTAEGLESTAQTIDGECMSFIHQTLPITGIQYHPEAILTEYGIDVLANWLKAIK